MSAPDATPVFAIAGMHRSGTSLVAGLVRAAGLPMGEELVGASATNPHGHHEDRAFVALHDAALAACGTGWTLDRAPEQLGWSEGVEAQARALVTARAAHGAWGWKDPRTTLFLAEWKRVVPALRVVIVFREAATVVASLRRRRDPPLVHRFHGAWPLRRLGLPMTRDAQSFRMWRRYNECALAFARAHPDDCVFVDARGIGASWAPLRAWMQARGAPLGDIQPADHLDPKLLRAKAPLDLAMRARVPSVRRLESALRARAIA